MLSKKFRKFLLQSKYKNESKDTNNTYICYKCNKPGHLKKDCPLLKSNFKNKSEHSKKNKKAYQATWDDSDSSSSENEVTNMCFIT